MIQIKLAAILTYINHSRPSCDSDQTCNHLDLHQLFQTLLWFTSKSQPSWPLSTIPDPSVIQIKLAAILSFINKSALSYGSHQTEGGLLNILHSISALITCRSPCAVSSRWGSLPSSWVLETLQLPPPPLRPPRLLQHPVSAANRSTYRLRTQARVVTLKQPCVRFLDDPIADINSDNHWYENWMHERCILRSKTSSRCINMHCINVPYRRTTDTTGVQQGCIPQAYDRGTAGVPHWYQRRTAVVPHA